MATSVAEEASRDDVSRVIAASILTSLEMFGSRLEEASLLDRDPVGARKGGGIF